MKLGLSSFLHLINLKLFIWDLLSWTSYHTSPSLCSFSSFLQLSHPSHFLFYDFVLSCGFNWTLIFNLFTAKRITTSSIFAQWYQLSRESWWHWWYRTMDIANNMWRRCKDIISQFIFTIIYSWIFFYICLKESMDIHLNSFSTFSHYSPAMEYKVTASPYCAFCSE